MFRRLLFPIFLLSLACPSFATVFGTVRGIVHDSQHRPIPSTTVVLKAENSDYTQTTNSTAEGDFHCVQRIEHC